MPEKAGLYTAFSAGAAFGATGLVLMLNGQPSLIAFWAGLVLACVGFSVAAVAGTRLWRVGVAYRIHLNALTQFLARGRGLADRAAPGFLAERHFYVDLIDDAEEWVNQVETFFRNTAAFGPSYIERFRCNATLPIYGAVVGGQIPAWLQAFEDAIRQRCASLDAIIAELQGRLR